MAMNTTAGKIVKQVKGWIMEERASELDKKSLLHLLNSDKLDAPLGLAETLVAFVTDKEDAPVRIDPEELEEFEASVKKLSEKYI